MGNFFDNTPALDNLPQNLQNAKLRSEECERFLEKSAWLLKNYTLGYGLWSYWGYNESQLFNGAFLRGLEGWKVHTGGEANIKVADDGFLLLEVAGGIASVKQGQEQADPYL